MVDLSNYKFSDSIVSIKLGTAKVVTLYENELCTGNQAIFTENNSCMKTSSSNDAKLLANRSNSISILFQEQIPKDGCIAVYVDACFQGGRQEICDDIADLSKLGFNDNISSIYLGKGVKGVSVFLDPGYEGIGYGIKSTIANLNQGALRMFNDQISSLRIFKWFIST